MQVVTLIQSHTGKRTAAVGDGGNDVSMIQAADAGNRFFFRIVLFKQAVDLSIVD